MQRKKPPPPLRIEKQEKTHSPKKNEKLRHQRMPFLLPELCLRAANVLQSFFSGHYIHTCYCSRNM